MITFFLALVIFAHLDTVPPRMFAAFASQDDCATAAREANSELDKEPGSKGARFVCLRMLGDA